MHLGSLDPFLTVLQIQNVTMILRQVSDRSWQIVKTLEAV